MTPKLWTAQLEFSQSVLTSESNRRDSSKLIHTWHPAVGVLFNYLGDCHLHDWITFFARSSGPASSAEDMVSRLRGSSILPSPKDVLIVGSHFLWETQLVRVQGSPFWVTQWFSRTVLRPSKSQQLQESPKDDQALKALYFVHLF